MEPVDLPQWFGLLHHGNQINKQRDREESFEYIQSVKDYLPLGW